MYVSMYVSHAFMFRFVLFCLVVIWSKNSLTNERLELLLVYVFFLRVCLQFGPRTPECEQFALEERSRAITRVFFFAGGPRLLKNRSVG